MGLVDEILEKRKLVELLKSDEAEINLTELLKWFRSVKEINHLNEELRVELEKVVLEPYLPPITTKLAERAAIGYKIMDDCKPDNRWYSIWDSIRDIGISSYGNHFKESDFNRIKKLYLLPFWDYILMNINSEKIDNGTLPIVRKDSYLDKLLSESIRYYECGEKRKAIRFIVDAFERAKSCLHKDKKKSIEYLLIRISDNDMVKKQIESEMRALTNIANTFGIRHHDYEQVQIEDDSINQFLFYRFYNMVRLILRKVGDL